MTESVSPQLGLHVALTDCVLFKLLYMKTCAILLTVTRSQGAGQRLCYLDLWAKFYARVILKQTFRAGQREYMLCRQNGLPSFLPFESILIGIVYCISWWCVTISPTEHIWWARMLIWYWHDSVYFMTDLLPSCIFPLIPSEISQCWTLAAELGN